jgi:tyrosinase
MSPRPAPYSTFSVTGGDIQSEDTPLEPFWDKSGTKFWTSAQIKDTTTFGYAYPETQKWRFPDQQSYQTSIRQAVTALYGTNVFTNFVANNLAKRKDEHAVAVSALAAQTKHQAAANDAGAAGDEPPAATAHAATAAAEPTVFTTLASAPPSHPPLSSSSAKQEAEEGPIPASLRHLAPNNAYTEWVVNVRAEKHGLGASFRVLVFLGAFDEADPSGWDTEFNWYVDSISFFASFSVQLWFRVAFPLLPRHSLCSQAAPNVPMRDETNSNCSTAWGGCRCWGGTGRRRSARGAAATRRAG